MQAGSTSITVSTWNKNWSWGGGGGSFSRSMRIPSTRVSYRTLFICRYSKYESLRALKTLESQHPTLLSVRARYPQLV